MWYGSHRLRFLDVNWPALTGHLSGRWFGANYSKQSLCFQLYRALSITSVKQIVSYNLKKMRLLRKAWGLKSSPSRIKRTVVLWEGRNDKIGWGLQNLRCENVYNLFLFFHWGKVERTWWKEEHNSVLGAWLWEEVRASDFHGTGQHGRWTASRESKHRGVK